MYFFFFFENPTLIREPGTRTYILLWWTGGVKDNTKRLENVYDSAYRNLLL